MPPRRRSGRTGSRWAPSVAAELTMIANITSTPADMPDTTSTRIARICEASTRPILPALRSSTSGPVDVHDEQLEHVREDRQREPAQDQRVAIVAHEDLEQQDRAGHRDDQDGERHRDEQSERLGHRPQVGADVEDVGADHQDGGEPQDRPREPLLDQGHQPAAARQAEPRGCLLHRRGEREKNAVHTRSNRNVAPTCEYVPIRPDRRRPLP